MTCQSPLFYKPKNPFLTILKAWLVAGTLDGISAMIHYTLRGGRPPEKIFKYVASGVFGKEAITEGASMVCYGILFHYTVAFLFTLLFFFIFRGIKFLSKNKFIAGIIYGLFVWLIMNLIVVPNSNVPKFPFNPVQSILGMLILIVMIGLPLSFIIGNYFARNIYTKQSR